MGMAAVTDRGRLLPGEHVEVRRESPVAARRNARLVYDVAVHPMSHLPADSTLELLVRAQAGDDEALNGLLLRFLPRLQRWASGRLPAHARHLLDTGDVVQDAMIAALRRLDSFEIRHDGALQAYLRQAVKNRLTDLFRQSERRPGFTSLPDDLRAKDPSPVELAIGAEALHRYETALEHMSDSDRQLVILRVEFGHDYAQIAEAMGKPTEGAARVAVGRALAKLASEMGRVG